MFLFKVVGIDTVEVHCSPRFNCVEWIIYTEEVFLCEFVDSFCY